MRREFSKKGQSTAEYAIVIALVIGAVIATQNFVKRGLQGRIKDGLDTFVTSADHNAIDFGTGNVGGTSVDYSFADYTTAQYGAKAVDEDAKYLESRTDKTIVGAGTSETETLTTDGKSTKDTVSYQTREVDEKYDYEKLDK